MTEDQATAILNSPLDNDFEQTEPLLGQPGSPNQAEPETRSARVNVIFAPIAQLGVWGFTLTVYYNVIFRGDWMLFSFHPVLPLLLSITGSA